MTTHKLHTLNTLSVRLQNNVKELNEAKQQLAVLASN